MFSDVRIIRDFTGSAKYYFVVVIAAKIIGIVIAQMYNRTNVFPIKQFRLVSAIIFHYTILYSFHRFDFE